jgi:hypothetical protein
MGKKYLFATGKDGKSHEVKVDPAHLDRQTRDLTAAGYELRILDEDERIRMGLIAQQLRNNR